MSSEPTEESSQSTRWVLWGGGAIVLGLVVVALTRPSEPHGPQPDVPFTQHRSLAPAAPVRPESAPISSEAEARRREFHDVSPDEAMTTPPLRWNDVGVAPVSVGQSTHRASVPGTAAEVVVTPKVGGRAVAGQLVVDGAWKGPVPFTGVLPAGPHRFRIDAPGYPVNEFASAVLGGSVANISVNMRSSNSQGDSPRSHRR